MFTQMKDKLFCLFKEETEALSSLVSLKEAREALSSADLTVRGVGGGDSDRSPTVQVPARCPRRSASKSGSSEPTFQRLCLGILGASARVSPSEATTVLKQLFFEPPSAALGKRLQPLSSRPPWDRTSHSCSVSFRVFQVAESIMACTSAAVANMSCSSYNGSTFASISLVALFSDSSSHPSLLDERAAIFHNYGRM